MASKDLIDLTSENDEILPPTLDIQSSLDPGSNTFKNDKPLRPAAEITNFTWISLDQQKNEFSYLETFLEIYKNDNVQYQKLDLNLLDPNYQEPASYGLSVAEKIEKRLAKEGTLYSRKKPQDDYDFEDDFVDDSANPNQAMLALGRIIPKYEDFVLYSGGIESFRRSAYAKSRLKTAEEGLDVGKSKKSHKSKKQVKEPTKRKNDDNISRPEEEFKKPKLSGIELE